MGNCSSSSDSAIILETLDRFHIEIMESIKKQHETRLNEKYSESKELLYLIYNKKCERQEYVKTIKMTQKMDLKLSGDKLDETIIEFSNTVSLM